MNDQEREAKLIEIILSLQAQIGGLEAIVQGLVMKSQGKAFDEKTYHKQLMVAREAYRQHTAFRLEDVDPAAASRFFPAPPGLIPPEETEPHE